MSVSTAVIKRLYATSGNVCSFPECKKVLVDEKGVHVGEIAHIEAENPGGARYNSSQSDSERFGYENLILLCPNHHTLIDKDLSTYSIAVLKEIKANHVSRHRDIELSVSFVTQSRTPAKHQYQLKIVVTNNSSTSLNKPKLAIILPSQVLSAVSSRSKKIVEGRMAQVYFDELDVSTIHPGEEKILMETSNVGLYYFMNSDLHDDSFVMNQNMIVRLFADGVKPVIVSESFKKMQEF